MLTIFLAGYSEVRPYHFTSNAQFLSTSFMSIQLFHSLTLTIVKAVFCYELFLLQTIPRASSHPICASKQETSASSCPPFNSDPPFPFSVSPGCGHPSFPVKCSTPYSVISINNFSFSLLHYELNSYSLLLSPRLHNTSEKLTSEADNNCSSSQFFSIPDRAVDLSGSPFSISDASCSRLYSLRPCSQPTTSNCGNCPWECKIIQNPARIVHDCQYMHRPVSSEQGCEGDILGYLDKFFKIGIQVEWDETQDSYFSSCKGCQAKNGVCGFNSSDPNKQFICFHVQSLSTPWINHQEPKRIAILCLIVALSCLLLLVSVATVLFRSRKFASSSIEEDPTTLFLHRHRSASLLPPVFSFEELEASTNRFDPKRKIGDGGFGCVYLGQLYDGRIVAVKYLHKQHQQASAGRAFSNKSFCNEILILSSIDHPNLVKLHGYCSDPRGLLLVYDYVANGTLADHLHGPKCAYGKVSLTWQVRLDIALQTASVMEYLHFSVVPPIVHRDITSSNIFVEKDMRIKVGDFGLSRLLVFQDNSPSSSGYVWTGPQGTPGYLDPDYHRSFRLTEKSDVYSFGVVLLELISGLKAVDQNREKREMALADMVVLKIQMGLLPQVVDPALPLDKDTMDAVSAAAELAFRCVAAEKDDRPDSKEIVEELWQIKHHRSGLRSSSSNAGDEVVKI